MKKIINLTTLFILLSSNSWCQELSMVKLIYGAEGILLPISAQCSVESFEYSFGEDINFLTTYDKIFLEEFSILSQKLTVSKSGNIDPRIMAISYKIDNSPNDTIYLGEFYGIYKNNQLMKDNDKFLNLIKAKIGWRNKHKSILFEELK